MHSYEEIIDETRYRASVRSADRIGSARIGVSEMTWKPGRVKNLTARYSALTLYRSAAPIKHTIAGQDRPTRQFFEGDLMVRPPNLNYETEYGASVDICVFALETDFVRTATTAFNADVGSVFGRLECRPFRSPLVEGLAKQLSACAGAGGDRLYSDALSQAMIHELWRMADGVFHPSEQTPGTLTQRQMRQIDEAIAGAPGGQIALDHLAGIVGMSMAAFAAAMKETTGLTPYKYVLSRRTAQARDLVENTTLPLAEIAFRCGFSSQSHMTDVFRAKLGATPGRLRSKSA